MTIVGIQFTIPAALLILRGGDPLPSAFGWQMFTSHGDRYAATIIDANGTRRPIDVDSLLMSPRAELRLDRALVDYLCQRRPGEVDLDVAAVEVAAVEVAAVQVVSVEVQLGEATTTTDCP